MKRITRTMEAWRHVALCAFAAAIVVVPARSQLNCASSHASAWFPGDWPQGSGGLGSSISISASGKRVAIGASFATHQGHQSGAVYMITDPGTPQQGEHTILPSVVTWRDQFGTSVALSDSGDVLVVGAPGPSFQSLGHAFVYRFDGRKWQEELHIGSSQGDRLGRAVDISDDGNLVVVGAPEREPTLQFVSGAIEVYRRQGGAWVNEATVIPTDVVLSHVIGLSISLSGDGRFLAARTNSSVNSFPNATIYVFENVGNSWVQRAKLLDPAGGAPGFGMALDFDAHGDVLAVGNWQDGRLVYMQGAVTIFRRSISSWAYDSVLLPATPTSSGGFGFALAINASGDRVLAGAPAQFQGLYRGVVEEFELFAGGSQRLGVHVSPNPQDEGQFGRWIGMNSSGSKSVAAKPLADTYGTDFGEIHVFDATCLTPEVYCTAQTNTLGCVPRIEAQGTPSVSSPSGFRISAHDVRNQQNGMLIYGTNGRAATPWLGGTLCVQPPLRRTRLVNSGGSSAPANDCSGALVRDFNAWAFAANDPALFPGQHVRAQFYSRDPGASHNLNLSDAVEFYLEP